MAEADLLALVLCDLGAIVRGRSVRASELADHLAQGVGWVPANHALTPLGGLADDDPFGSTGDLRLLPDETTRACVQASLEATPLDLVLCDIVETDGRPWECCPRTLLRSTIDELERELGVSVLASFEHEFQLPREEPAALPFSLEAQRRSEPFATRLMLALEQAGLEPERIFPEYASDQFEVPVAAAPALTAADRAVVLREVVREVARREGLRATFVPLLREEEAGNGVHIHVSLREGRTAALYDPARPGCLSELGGSFAAGVLAHAAALTAVTAPSPVSAARLAPHRWSAGAACLALRNREALLRLPPLLSLGNASPAEQMRLEYRAADATANPYLALSSILRAGLDGVRRGLPTPPILDRDPARLDAGERERYGVGALPASLGDALAALAEDGTASGWFPPLLLEAFRSVKRAELAATAGLDLEQTARRYATVY